jgi:hypothetical protein
MVRLGKGEHDEKESIYVGGTHMKMYHGWGILMEHGNLYEGRFSLGKKMGKGYMKFGNGNVLMGEWVNDKIHGEGVMKDENEYYSGDFENGVM